jgi:predicted Zn-dependent protease
MAAGTRAASLEDLYRDVARGLLVVGTNYVTTDHQLASGMLPWATMFEINRGKLVSRVRNRAITFATRVFWKNLTELGDRTTLQVSQYGSAKGFPWQGGWLLATAPATRFAAVNVVAT